MPGNDLNKDEFDKMLRAELREHTEPVPADFAAKMLRRLREAEQQRILARVALQERLALAGCIVLGAAVIVLAVMYPGIANALTQQVADLGDKLTKTVSAIRLDWQVLVVFAGVLGFAAYGLWDLLLGDSY
jgi:multisubunit Na+/H+ antiporter MnhB subunit